jgi:hypothetical protein
VKELVPFERWRGGLRSRRRPAGDHPPRRAAEEFFDATIQNDHIRRAYRKTVKHFLTCVAAGDWNSPGLHHATSAST